MSIDNIQKNKNSLENHGKCVPLELYQKVYNDRKELLEKINNFNLIMKQKESEKILLQIKIKKYEKEKKIEKEISRIQLKHNSEIQAMELKIENHKNQLLREKANKIYEIELKYKNKERALERQHKAERESYERIISNKGRKNYSRSMPKNY